MKTTKIKVIISRTYENLETRGSLLVVFGEKKLFEGKVLELPDKDNAQQISCIPEGTYEMVKQKSEKFGDAFLIKNVPNRTAVMMHVGNYAAGMKVDTRGCLLPGYRFTDMNADGILDIAESTAAMKELNRILPDSTTLVII